MLPVMSHVLEDKALPRASGSARRRDLLALAGAIGYATAGFGYRTWVHHRRTGDSGWAGFRGMQPAQQAAKVLIGAGAAGTMAGPALAVARPRPTNGSAAPALTIGSVLFATGFAVTMKAQTDLGASWRIGVDPQEQTDLITDGCFARVRNPIFTGMLLAATGIATLTPNKPTIAGAVALAAGIVLQVRHVEEPYLRRIHGRTYAAYEARTGRFLPRLGGRCTG